MLISELAQNPAARVVEREQDPAAPRRAEPRQTGRVDAATAAKIGKLVGARYMVMGSFIDFYGDFRVDARLVDVETSEIVKVGHQRSECRSATICSTSSSRSREKLMTETKLPPLPAEREPARKARKVPTEALTYYSRALLYQDRGDKAKAAEYYSKALGLPRATRRPRRG